MTWFICSTVVIGGLTWLLCGVRRLRNRVVRDYTSVPFRPVGTVTVHYRHVGPLKLTPYPMEE